MVKAGEQVAVPSDRCWRGMFFCALFFLGGLDRDSNFDKFG